MAAPSAVGSGERSDPQAGCAARRKLEEALGKLDISEEEATPLILGDHIEGRPEKWLLAGKVLYRNYMHPKPSLIRSGRHGAIRAV